MSVFCNKSTVFRNPDTTMGPFDVSHDAFHFLELHAFGAEIHAWRLMSESRDWYIGSRDSCCAEYEIYTRSHHFIIPKPYQSEIYDTFLHFWHDLFYFLVEDFLFLGLYFTLRYFRMTQSEKKLKLGQIFYVFVKRGHIKNFILLSG